MTGTQEKKPQGQGKKQKPQWELPPFADLSAGQEYMTLTAAGERLGYKKQKMTWLVQRGFLHAYRTPLNGRVRLVPVVEVDVLERQLRQLRGQSAHMARKRDPRLPTPKSAPEPTPATHEDAVPVAITA